MRLITLCVAAWLALAAGLAWALTADEVIQLKKAGVSDATIQKMLEQQQRGGSQGGPVSESQDAVTYQAGQNTPDEVRRMERHERWKEEKSMEALKGVIIDQRGNQPQPPPASGGTGR